MNFKNNIRKLIELVLLLLFIILQTQLNGQAHLKKGWEMKSSGGIDFSGLLKINPAAGSGDSQLSFGSAFSSSANFNSNKIAWSNSISLNYGIQKNGFNNSPGTNTKIPFQKSIDQFRINSKFGYRSSILYPGARFLYSIDFSFLSQITKTYVGNFVNKPGSDLGLGDAILSKFLSPGTIHISPGIDYKPIDQVSIYYSPVGFKFLMVLDDEIADDIVIDDQNNLVTTQGNPIILDDNGMLIGFKNVDSQIGSLLRVSYIDSFWDKRGSIDTRISLYSNYLNRPEKIDIDWTCEIGINIVEGLQISLWSNLFYDYDIPVQKTKNLQVVEGFTRGVSFTQQFLLKYTRTF